MIVFNTMEDLISHLAIEYPKSQGKTLASWQVSEILMLTGVYEYNDLVHGFFIYKDPTRDYKWILVDNFHADLSVRNYIDYIEEMQEALALFEVMNLFEKDSDKDEEIEELDFYEDLD